jgi:hypothetical protein
MTNCFRVSLISSGYGKKGVVIMTNQQKMQVAALYAKEKDLKVVTKKNGFTRRRGQGVPDLQG